MCFWERAGRNDVRKSWVRCRFCLGLPHLLPREGWGFVVRKTPHKEYVAGAKTAGICPKLFSGFRRRVAKDYDLPVVVEQRPAARR